MSLQNEIITSYGYIGWCLQLVNLKTFESSVYFFSRGSTLYTRCCKVLSLTQNCFKKIFGQILGNRLSQENFWNPFCTWCLFFFFLLKTNLWHSSQWSILLSSTISHIPHCCKVTTTICLKKKIENFCYIKLANHTWEYFNMWISCACWLLLILHNVDYSQVQFWSCLHNCRTLRNLSKKKKKVHKILDHSQYFQP